MRRPIVSPEELQDKGMVNVMRWVALGLCGALIASCGSDKKPEVGRTRQALFYSPAADAFAIYARNSIHIEDGSKVGGPVGVYLQDPVLPSDVLADDVRLAVGEWTDVGKTSQTDIFASTATFHFGANVKAAYTQRVDLDLHNLGTVSQNVSFIMKPFPRARPVTPGSGLLTVAASSTVTITSTTTARVVEVQDGAVLRLGAGTYRFEDLLVADHAAVVALGVVEVRVSSRIQVGKGARLFATSNTAGHLRIEALGRNGGLGLPTDTPRAIDVGDYSRVRAVLFAPNGTIKIGESTTSTGAVVAKDVWLGSSAKLAFQSGLAPLSGTVPLAYPDLFGATEDHALTVPAEGVLANDLDPAYDSITAVLVTHARNGTVSLAANGGFTYTPNAQFEGLDSFTYRASDGTLQSSVVTASIAVDSANDIPVISSEPPATAYVGQRWRYLPTVVDPDVGDTKTFSLVSPPSGVTIDSGTGLVSWTPVTGQIGSRTIVVRVVDAANTSDSQTFSVSVLASPALDHFSLYADNSLWLGGGVIDGSLGVRATGSGTWLNSYARTYIEANAIAGKVGGADLYGDTVVLGSGSIAQDVYTNSLVSDLSASRGAVVALPAMPALPTAGSATPGTGTLSVPAYGTATLSPSESYQTITVGSYGCLYLQPGTHHVQTLTLSTVGCLAAQGAVDLRVSGKLSAGSYAYIGPATGANITPSQFRIEVLGTNGGSGVWSTPLAVSLGTRSSIFATIIARNGTLETGGSSMNWGRFIARDIHAQGYFLLGEPSTENRAPAIVSSPITSIPERSNYVYAVTATDPDVDDTLSYSLITAPAGMTISSTAGTVRWPSAVIGSYPVAIRVSDAAGAIDTQGFTLTVTDINDPPVISSSPSTSGTVGQAYSYAVAATDPENDALSYSLGSAPSGMSISAGGQVSWTPGTGQSGNASVSINVVDARGAYTTQNFTITVVSPNHAPVFTQSPSTQAVVGQLYASSTHALDQDVGDTIHYEIVSGPSGLTIDAATGALRWTPLSAQVGAHSLVLRVLDAAGASATQTTGLTVTLANRPPEFTSTPNTSIDEGDSYSYQATATDPDAGDTVQFSLESGPAGLSMSTSGLVSWNPGNSQVGEFGVVLQIEDQAHHVVTQSYRITVNNVNAAPEITSQPPTQATEAIEYQYNVSASDPDAHDTLTFSLGAAPSGMSITGSRISWTPTHGLVGSHSVQVTVTDAGGLTASQSFSVTVADVNDPPSFVSSPALYATQHQAYTYAASALDPDVGDSVVYQLDVGPSGMSIHPTTGVVTWTPGPMQVGIYDVILRATDQTGALDIQSYALSVANGNDPPAFITTPETSATENQLYLYAARALDPDPNTTLTYLLISGPAGMTVGRSTGDVRWVPGTADRGVHAVHIRVTDDVATADDQTFDVTVGGAAAACTGSDTSARCTALGFAYAIGRDSVPLGGVSVEETDPSSSHRSLTSDPRSGGVALGSGVSGEYEWLFHATGYVPAYRRGELADDRVTFTAVPRLTPVTDAIATVETGGGAVADVDGLVSLSFASGAVSAATEIRLAVLDSQSLPGFLPRGYSPAAALWYEASASLSTTPSATLVLPAPVGAGATARLARWDASAAEWVYARAVSVTAPTAAHPIVTVQLDGPGGYAVVLLDASPTAPPAISVGQALQGATDPGFDLTALEAHGVVEPTTQVASPIAQQVTGDGQVWVNPPTTTPSGLVLPARVYETYSFAEAPPSEVPTMDLSVALYRYPPVPGAPANALSAHFQVRPRQLIEGADVRQRIELLHAATFDGLPVDAAGGSIARDNIVLTIPSGAFTSPTLVRLAPMTDPTLTLSGASATRVFTLEWSGDGLTAAAPFFLDVGMVAPNAEYVLAGRFVTERGSGFTPVERFASNASGALSSVEPSSGARLPGIRVGGTYALFPVAAREGLLVGTARDAGGAALSDVLLEVSGRPWRALTAASGTFALLGLPGPVEVTATRPPSTDTGRASDTLASAASSVTLTVVVGQSAPFVVSITPSAGATEVSVVAPVDVMFSEPIAAASLAAPGAISLAKVTGAIVPGHVTTRIDRRGASFLPDRPLEPGTTYTATVAVVADEGGLTLTGTRVFHFTTAPERSIARASARLTSYAPGSAQNPCAPYNPNEVDAEFDPTGLSLGAPGFDASDPHLTCVVGNVGTADPGLPVVIVNDDDGGATTVIARPNGSFKGYLRAAEEDLLTANFVRRDGSQLAIPLEMQRFDDGRVGLYSAGGVVRAPNPFGGEPFEIIVEPGSIGRRGVFKFSPQTPAEALAAVGVAPADGGLIVAGAVVEYSGDQLRTSADVRFPIAEEDLVLPPGSTAATAGFILTQSAQVRSGGEEVTVYDTIDRMRYEAGALGTHSYPMVGLMPLLGPSPFAQVQIIALAYAQRATPFTGYVVACVPDDPTDQDDPCYTDAVTARATLVDGVVSVSGRNAAVGVWERRGRALDGAFVAASSALQQSSILLLRSGSLVAMTDRSGRYALAAPVAVGSAPTFFATHPDYVHPSAGASGTSGFGTTIAYGFPTHLDFVFSEAMGANSLSRGPTISVTHTPNSPDPWDGQAPLTATNQARVALSARGSLEMPTAPELRVVEAAAVVAGQTVVPSDIVITDDALSEDVAGLSVRQEYLLTSPRAARVVLEARVTEGNAVVTSRHLLRFGTGAAPTTDSADPNDTTPPTILWTSPTNGARGVALDEPIRIVFTKPISQSVLSHAADLLLTPPAGTPSLVLSNGDTMLDVVFPGLEPGLDYELEIGAGISDRANRPFDRDPATEQAESTTYRFQTAAEAAVDLAGVGRGGGAAMHGGFAYVLDRGDGSLRVFNVTDPTAAGGIEVGHQLLTGGYPRSIRVIPDYSYVRPGPTGGPASPPSCNEPFTSAVIAEIPWTRNIDPLVPVYSACASLHRTLVAIIGGLTSNGGLGQYLAILDVTDPTHIVTVAQKSVTAESSATLGSLRWSPPTLAYLEYSGGDTRIHLVSLQEFIFGTYLSAEQLRHMPPNGVPGIDEDLDGSYVGPNDVLPMPPPLTAAPFFGDDRVLRVGDTRQSIRDYFVDGPGLFIGVALSEGVVLDETGAPIANAVAGPSYRTLSKGPLFNTSLPRSRADLTFGGASVDSVFGLPRISIPIQVSLAAPPTTELRDLVLVLTSTPSAEASAVRAYLVDVTDPLTPLLVGPTGGIEVPAHNPIRRIEADPVSADRLSLFSVSTVAHGNEQISVSISQLGLLALDPDAGHPAILGVEQGLGGRTDIALGEANTSVLADADTNRVYFRGPSFEFVSFPTASTILDPTALAAESEGQVRQALAGMVSVQDLRLSRVQAEANYPSTITPASLERHYRVLVRAPGGDLTDGVTINLVAEGTNEAGAASADAPVGLAPTRAVSQATFARQGLTPNPDAPLPQPLTAHRLSNDRGSLYYNVYLSDTFALVGERLSAAEVDALDTVDGQPRRLFHSLSGLRVSIDPDRAPALLAPYASTIESGSVRVGTSGRASSFAMPRVAGPNPVPVNGSPAKAPGSMGMVNALNGELDLSSTDLALPSPMMPLVFARTYRAQDKSGGPLGPGWDFTYNQRIVEAKNTNVPTGEAIPLVVRESTALDTRVEAGDLKLQTGDGRILVFKRAPGTGVPAGYASDPLLTSLVGAAPNCVYYLPPSGIFDAMVRFGTHGSFLRQTPNGTQYKYDPSGRLTDVHAPFPANHHQVVLNDLGEIDAIVDRSTSTLRKIEIGYYRERSDPRFRASQDIAPENAGGLHKIARIVQVEGSNTHGDVLFHYDDHGELTSVDGVELRNVHPDGFQGRRTITYTWSHGLITGVSGADANGAVLLANTGPAPELVSQAAGADGALSGAAPAGNSSRSLQGGTSHFVTADQTTTTFTWDAMGRPSDIVVQGGGSTEATHVARNSDGRPTTVVAPKGNSLEPEYDSSNVNIRSRGNVTIVRSNGHGVSVATEIRVIPAESSGSPDQVFDGLGSAGYGGRKDAGWSWTSTPPTDRLSETDTLI